jgi:hypothetical protein
MQKGQPELKGTYKRSNRKRDFSSALDGHEITWNQHGLPEHSTKDG